MNKENFTSSEWYNMKDAISLGSDDQATQKISDILSDSSKLININWNDNKWIEYIKQKMNDKSLSPREISYYNRILRVLSMPDLSKQPWHPINLVINKILSAHFFEWFDHIDVPQFVSEWETFDLFNFPENHVARRPSDSYFVNKSEIKKESILLRPHTSVMWYHYLIEWKAKEILEKTWEVKALSFWKVYRVDELDKTHHECFHQIDGLRITSKEKEIINQDTLKEVLSNTIKALFWENVKFRFNQDQFPYTTDSLEVEVEFEWKWLEVLWAWVVHPTVLEKLWLDSTKYNWWAFGFGIDRLVMALKKVPDIRILRSEDKRITSQWWNLNPYKEVSNFPPVYKDISFVTSKDKFVKNTVEMEKSWKIELINEADSFDLAGIARDVSWWLIEEVRVIDIFENDKKFGNDKKSVCVRITFRSLERTLTNEEINIAYFKIREKLEKELNYELR
ncbi:MAG: hypothetical protein ACD_80C00011G0012 [uncultured bacterium (gcode 4)]|uniref:Phenylalanyl-tRNA synthetase n=1 Tax=uncultured bacterium (gcode 4) TaxID=1234023 RepID=K1X5X0_9BACT|nr:MAG: hypothetical protein ACD_80C00011G0012 [uncultured bacterium (gcode 4)]